MGEIAHPAGQRAAAEYLRSLLLKPGRYRDAWEQRVERPRDGVINQLAVSEVIAEHLRASKTTNGVNSHQIKESVAQVLSGRLVSRDSLAQFSAAFGFSEDETGRLGRLLNGSTAIGLLSGSHAVPMRAEQEVIQVLGPRRHQTLSLHDHVWVGNDRRIERVRMLPVIEATARGVDRIPLICDTSVLTVEVGQGCKELVGPLRRVREDAYVTEILLARTLDLGETITLEYWLTYQYPGDMSDPEECRQRHAVLRHLENFDMRIEFHPDRLPSRVWWARWDGVEGDVAEEREVTLDSQHAVHRYMRSISKAVVGFRWEWD
jgi:hypothetical protein